MYVKKRRIYAVNKHHNMHIISIIFHWQGLCALHVTVCFFTQRIFPVKVVSLYLAKVIHLPGPSLASPVFIKTSVNICQKRPSVKTMNFDTVLNHILNCLTSITWCPFYWFDITFLNNNSQLLHALLSYNFNTE